MIGPFQGQILFILLKTIRNVNQWTRFFSHKNESLIICSRWKKGFKKSASPKEENVLNSELLIRFEIRTFTVFLIAQKTRL